MGPAHVDPSYILLSFAASNFRFTSSPGQTTHFHIKTLPRRDTEAQIPSSLVDYLPSFNLSSILILMIKHSPSLRARYQVSPICDTTFPGRAHVESGRTSRLPSNSRLELPKYRQPHYVPCQQQLSIYCIRCEPSHSLRKRPKALPRNCCKMNRMIPQRFILH